MRGMNWLFMFGIFISQTLYGTQYEQLLNRIALICEDNSKYSYLINGTFDEKGNLWLSYFQTRKLYWEADNPRTAYGGDTIYWYVQKFNKDGFSYFPAVEVTRRKIPYGGGGPVFPGNLGDAYTFVGSMRRIDGDGNLFIYDGYRGYLRNMFIDYNNIMYVISSDEQGLNNVISKFKIQKSTPVLFEKQELPFMFDNKKYGDYYKNYPYNWIETNLITFNKQKHMTIALRPIGLDLNSKGLNDTSTIKVYSMDLPRMVKIDTFSFKIVDALHKKVTGMKYKVNTHERNTGSYEINTILTIHNDTLLLFLLGYESSGNVIYVCKLTSDGMPIKSSGIQIDSVKPFDDTTEVVIRKLIIRGPLANSLSEPKGMMVYGFDAKGNVYYEVWKGSDKFWRME